MILVDLSVDFLWEFVINILKEDELKNILGNDYYTTKTKEDKYVFMNRYLNNFQGIKNCDYEKLLYTYYYIFIQFKKDFLHEHGYDAGIEQEGFKILEFIDNELQYLDWNQIRNIEDSI